MGSEKAPLDIQGKPCRYFSGKLKRCSPPPDLSGGGECTGKDYGCLVAIEFDRLRRGEPSPGGTAMYGGFPRGMYIY